MWAERLTASAEGRRRFVAAIRPLWPLALGMLDPAQREQFRERALALLPPEVEGDGPDRGCERGAHSEELEPLWEEMTMVRRSAPGARW
jgi:1,2-phenylacetyl-CoA epoxidase catalytic subunit